MLCFDTRFFCSTVYKICSYNGLYLYIIPFCCCVIFHYIEELCFVISSCQQLFEVVMSLVSLIRLHSTKTESACQGKDQRKWSTNFHCMNPGVEEVTDRENLGPSDFIVYSTLTDRIHLLQYLQHHGPISKKIAKAIQKAGLIVSLFKNNFKLLVCI